MRYVLARSSTLPSRTFESHFSRRTFRVALSLALGAFRPVRVFFSLRVCLRLRLRFCGSWVRFGRVRAFLLAGLCPVSPYCPGCFRRFRPTITASSLNSWTVRELNISAVPACASVNRVVGVLREFGCDRFRTDDSDLTDGEGVGLCRFPLRCMGRFFRRWSSFVRMNIVGGGGKPVCCVPCPDVSDGESKDDLS